MLSFIIAISVSAEVNSSSSIQQIEFSDVDVIEKK